MNEIMNGIEVLNQTEIVQTPLEIGLTGIICGIIFFIGIVIAANIKNDNIMGFISFVVAIIAGIILIVSAILTLFVEEPTGKYQYDCLISEDVSMTEFYEKYEVVEINGKIWTIKEK